uniref:Uncharacterized protein n=1 Tax=Sphaerodactylus townsendi TaxID=933632 RepID=A0ACB8EBA7_9SAUR
MAGLRLAQRRRCPAEEMSKQGLPGPWVGLKEMSKQDLPGPWVGLPDPGWELMESESEDDTDPSGVQCHKESGSIRQEKTDTIRCIKSCRLNDVNCVLDPVHTISHTVISLPTFREFTRPEEIIFLRAITPAYPANQADIFFQIAEGNLRDSFDIVKRYMDGMTVGSKYYSEIKSKEEIRKSERRSYAGDLGKAGGSTACAEKA